MGRWNLRGLDCLRPLFCRADRFIPIRVGAVFDQVAIEVTRSIGPPRGTALAKRHLGRVYSATSVRELRRNACSKRFLYSPPCGHQLAHQVLPALSA